MSSVSDPINADTISKLSSSIKIIANGAVGFGNIDIKAAKERGITVTNTPDVLTDATADIQILLLLGASRKAYEGRLAAETQNWKWSWDFLLGKQMSNKRLGILGMGRIGRAVAKRAKAFNMEIHYHNRTKLSPDLEDGAIYHKDLKIHGYVKHDNVLNMLKKVSISVVCSRWEEPFGRTSLEAASRGCAVIISNRGGLPETSTNAIILKNLSSDELYKTIENLILDKKLLQKSQRLNYKNFIFDHKYISNLIDEIRATFVARKIFYTKKNKSFKIMHITNLNERFDGRLHYNTGRRLNNGFIRNGHNVLTLSDRDIIHNYKSIKDFSGKQTLQNKIIEAFNNFKPDIVILGLSLIHI